MQRYDGQHDQDRERGGRRDVGRRGQGRDFEDRQRDERRRFGGEEYERSFDEDREEERECLLRDQDRFGPSRFDREAPDFSQHRGRYGEEQRYYEERGGRNFGRFGEGRGERGGYGGGGYGGGGGFERSERGSFGETGSFGQQGRFGQQGGFGQQRRFGQQGGMSDFGPREWSEWQPQPAAGRWGGIGNERERGRHFGKGPKGYQRSEQRILEDVNDALERHPEVDASEISVSCENGMIVLRGTVESRHAKRLAEECVEDLPGVKDVRNELRTQAAGATGSQREQRATGADSSQGGSDKQRKM